MMSMMLTVAVRALKRCAVTRPCKCWMTKSSLDRVHRVGTHLTALAAIVVPTGRNFAKAPHFHDFQPVIVCSYQSWEKFRRAFQSLCIWNPSALSYPCCTVACVFEPEFYQFDLMWLISSSEHLDITMSALCTCCFVTFQAMSSM